MRKATAATVATIGIWVLGIASTSALVYALNRPLTPPPQVTDGSAIATTTAARADARVAYGTGTADASMAEPITLPSLTVVGHPRRSSTRAALTPPPQRWRWRDLSEMRCSDWKPLAMGSQDQGVRYCE